MNELIYQVPECLLGYLFNGDASGLTDNELKELQSFEASEFKNGYSVVDCSEPYFDYINDVNNMAGNICDVTILIY